MDIKILDSWLRDFLQTEATEKEIAKYLSLCGPSVERTKKEGDEAVYDIEITTNRIDSVSTYGIAREAAVILPRFGIEAKLKAVDIDTKGYKFVKEVDYIKAKVDFDCCKRFTAVLIRNVKIDKSPEKIQKRLELSGIRAINNIVDISNYVMLEMGQPVHTFDYNKILGKTMILRKSKRGEKITTLDKKEFTLPGGDIVIEDGGGRLIDLAGVMGGETSAVDENTKNVLLFVQTYDPVMIRKTSMGLAQRTMAATIFEKGTDTELVAPAILRGIGLFKELTRGTVEREILDIYPKPFKAKIISLDLEFIEKRLGISISQKDISNYLSSLGFENNWKGNIITVSVPSFRSQDVMGAEDIVEEIARIYGYHNLPSEIMTGRLTGRATSERFGFETKIKNYLSGWGGNEIYTLSLVPKDYVSEDALKLKNPLGEESGFLRTSLLPSLIQAAKENKGTFEKFHIFEMANVYLPKKNDLPEERMMLAGIFENHDYRSAKGIVEALLQKLKIDVNFDIQETKDFTAGKCAKITTDKEDVGLIGYPQGTNFVYYEFEVEKLFKLSRNVKEYVPIPKYPAQVEDITFSLPEKTMVGEVIDLFKKEILVTNCQLTDIYKNNYTFKIWYQSLEKTLTDNEVEKEREKIIKRVKDKFGGQTKD